MKQILISSKNFILTLFSSNFYFTFFKINVVSRLNSFLLLSIFLLPSISFSQYLESFNTAERGALTITPFTTNLAGVNWSVALGTFVGTVSATPTYAKTVSGALEFNNTDKEVCFTTPLLDISTPVGPRSISIPFEALQLELDDYIQVDYQVNGGAWVALGPQFGPGTRTVSVLSSTAGNTNLSGTITASGISGNTLMVRICSNNTNTLEFNRIFSVSVPETGTTVIQAPLPLSLISFTGISTEKGNELIWKTSSEVNFSHFEIERSENGKLFEKIGEIKGNKSESYEYLDNTDISYYRLKMIDLDNTFTYSKIVYIENPKNEQFTIYPNPSFDYFSVNNSDFAQLQIMDISGKILKTYSKSNTNKYSLTGLAKGQYFIKIKTGNQLINRKLMIEK